MATGDFLQVPSPLLPCPWPVFNPQKAIDIVKRAIEQDEKQDYQDAYRLYQQSLEYFMMALKCTSPRVSSQPDNKKLILQDEKNEKSKQMIKKKVGEYLERAEKLKTHLNKPTGKDGKPAAASANGVSSGGKAKYLSPSFPPPPNV
jgi:vacuolar protein-sorting-associated protein 4